MAVYIGKLKACGCVIAAVFDDPHRRKRTARDIGEMVMAGYIVEWVEGPVSIGGCPHEQTSFKKLESKK